ncbi:MAG: hypothetical protein PVF50_04325 [Gammaproteobacteria bacterium]|jgi:hypothetical protein
MPVLKQNLRTEFPPARFARRFRQFVGLRLSHVLVVALLLAAMYVATKSYSHEYGYVAPESAPSATSDTGR